VDKITRTLTDATGVKAKREYAVYTQEEADSAGIGYVHYKKATTAGEWVLSDDGYVAQIIRVNGPYSFRGRPKYEFILPYCRVWSTGSKRQLNYEEFREAGVYSWHSPKRSYEYSLAGKRFKEALKQYAFLYVTQKGVLSQEQLSEIGNLYRPDQKIPEATFLRAVRTKTGKAMLRSELTGLMAEHGITPAHVITQHQKIIEDALASGQLGVAEKANKQFIEMLDLTPDKVTVTEKLEGGIRFDHLIAAREETKQLDQ